MLEYLVDIDTRIFLWLNAHHSPFWDTFMYVASGRAIWIPLYLSILWMIYSRFGWRSLILLSLLGAVCVGLADHVCSAMLRPVIERLRPANPENPLSEFVHIVFDYRGGPYGFPSSHASNTFALAAYTSFLFRRWQYTCFIYLWALAICYSRIYLGVHYPGDILAGFGVGFILGWLTYVVAKMITEAYSGKFVNLEVDTQKQEGNQWLWPLGIGLATFVLIIVYSATGAAALF